MERLWHTAKRNIYLDHLCLLQQMKNWQIILAVVIINSIITPMQLFYLYRRRHNRLHHINKLPHLVNVKSNKIVLHLIKITLCVYNTITLNGQRHSDSCESYVMVHSSTSICHPQAPTRYVCHKSNLRFIVSTLKM